MHQKHLGMLNRKRILIICFSGKCLGYWPTHILHLEYIVDNEFLSVDHVIKARLYKSILVLPTLYRQQFP